MEIYFAPMEGMTSPLLRRTHAEMFGGCDKYYTPFISTNESISLNNREAEDVDHDQNRGLNLIPQIISNSAHQSALYIKLLAEKYGYGEVNINLGCPSGTVVSKGKGSGMLRDPEALDDYLGRLLEELKDFSGKGINVPRISIKARIGYLNTKEHIRITETIGLRRCSLGRSDHAVGRDCAIARESMHKSAFLNRVVKRFSHRT